MGEEYGIKVSVCKIDLKFNQHAILLAKPSLLEMEK
jgi:hypothetical protein